MEHLKAVVLVLMMALMTVSIMVVQKGVMLVDFSVELLVDDLDDW